MSKIGRAVRNGKQEKIQHENNFSAGFEPAPFRTKSWWLKRSGHADK